MNANGLRVGDVALCCPEASGRQGNIAYTLLAGRAFFCLLLLMLSSNYFFFLFQLCEQDDDYNAKHKLLYFRQPCKFFRVQDE